LIDIVDLSKPFVLNIDASDFALRAMLSRPKHDDILYLFSFHCCRFFLFEINYEVHDKKLSLQKNMTFQKVQLDRNVHIDQGGWLF
jgi:hypothetical protein